MTLLCSPGFVRLEPVIDDSGQIINVRIKSRYAESVSEKTEFDHGLLFADGAAVAKALNDGTLAVDYVPYPGLPVDVDAQAPVVVDQLQPPVAPIVGPVAHAPAAAVVPAPEDDVLGLARVLGEVPVFHDDTDASEDDEPKAPPAAAGQLPRLADRLHVSCGSCQRARIHAPLQMRAKLLKQVRAQRRQKRKEYSKEGKRIPHHPRYRRGKFLKVSVPACTHGSIT